MIYEQRGADEPLSQGDIIDECPIVFWEVTGRPEDPKPESATTQARVVVLTQACDLAQTRATRVLVAAVHQVQHLVDQSVLKAQMVRDQIRTHRVYGWYFLSAGAPMPESLVDLRDLHTIPRAMLERLIQEGKRVCRLQTPYREHLSQHFSTTYGRIGLPEPYPTQSEA
jgi:hypothetical protein